MKICTFKKSNLEYSSFDLDSSQPLTRQDLHTIAAWFIETDHPPRSIKIRSIGAKTLSFSLNDSESEIEIPQSQIHSLDNKNIRMVCEDALTDDLPAIDKILDPIRRLFAQLMRFYHYFTGKPARVMERNFSLLEDITSVYPVDGKVTMHMALK